MKSRVIVITSGKGGVGKTTTTANLGTSLAMMDKKVVLVDTDIGLRNLDVVMGLENRIVFDIVDVVNGKCRLKQALIKDKRFEGLHLLPAAQTKDKTAITPHQMKNLTNELRQDFDFILVDCPAGIEQGFRNAIAGADDNFAVKADEYGKKVEAIEKKLSRLEIKNSAITETINHLKGQKAGVIRDFFLWYFLVRGNKISYKIEAAEIKLSEIKDDYFTYCALLL